jgi:hypothetical protein
MNQESSQAQAPDRTRKQTHPQREETNSNRSNNNGRVDQNTREHRTRQAATPSRAGTNAQTQNEDRTRPGKGNTQTEATQKTQAGKTNTQSQAAETTGNANAKTQPSQNTQVGKTTTSGQKVAAQKNKSNPQTIKAQNANFHAKPKPQQVQAVSFNESHRITNAQTWQGSQYVAFRDYHPVWHDQAWYHSHYNRVQLIAGGWYFFNAGYWYPAWGYAPSAQYYVYDGPIYAGHQAEPPDKVIADVQASLQEQGYYKGEVDGLLGPLTREALNGYQADNGLYTTGAIDEPTLASLGMA